jgi:hypothetical protein
VLSGKIDFRQFSLLNTPTTTSLSASFHWKLRAATPLRHGAIIDSDILDTKTRERPADDGRYRDTSDCCHCHVELINYRNVQFIAVKLETFKRRAATKA